MRGLACPDFFEWNKTGTKALDVTSVSNSFYDMRTRPSESMSCIAKMLFIVLRSYPVSFGLNPSFWASRNTLHHSIIIPFFQSPAAADGEDPLCPAAIVNTPFTEFVEKTSRFVTVCVEQEPRCHLRW